MADLNSKLPKQHTTSLGSSKPAGKAGGGRESRRGGHETLASQISNLSISGNAHDAQKKRATPTHPPFANHSLRDAKFRITSLHAQNPSHGTNISNPLTFDAAAGTNKPNPGPSGSLRSSSTISASVPLKTGRARRLKEQGSKENIQPPTPGGGPRLPNSIPCGEPIRAATICIAIFHPGPGDDRYTRHWSLFLDLKPLRGVISGIFRSSGPWEYRETPNVRPDELPLHYKTLTVGSIPPASVRQYEHVVRNTAIQCGLPGWSSEDWVSDALEKMRELKLIDDYTHAIMQIYG
jgi:hypothetical protein